VRGLLRPRVGLVLGGGGARGFAHVGILQVLEEERIRPDLIVGCSMGSMVGALYALYQNAADVRTRLTEFTRSPQFQSEKFRDLQTITPLSTADQGFLDSVKRVYKLGVFFATTIFKPSFVDSRQYFRDVSAVVPEADIERTPIPLAIVATDLVTGEEVVLTKGSLRLAVQASSAIAGVFPPVLVNGRELVDGGFVNKVPVEVAFRLGADVVIAVDVSSDVEDSREFGRTGSAISVRASAILSETLKDLQLRFADVVIHPETSGVHWADFAGIDSIAPLGAEAARAALPKIRAAIRRGRLHRAAETLGFRRKWSVDLRKGP
jgi:NTE family protein